MSHMMFMFQILFSWVTRQDGSIELTFFVVPNQSFTELTKPMYLENRLII